jgi:hypothetical protein
MQIAKVVRDNSEVSHQPRLEYLYRHHDA